MELAGSGAVVSGEREVMFADGPFMGLYERAELDVPKGWVTKLKNAYVENGMIFGRPGSVQVGDTMPGGEKVQGPFYFEEEDGTDHTIAFSNGVMYEYDWVGETWDSVSFGASGVVVDVDADIVSVRFQGQIVFTDRVNDPWMWDGTTFTVLTAAPVAGHVTIYFSKLFFSDVPGNEFTFYWSNEFDPTTGYTAAESWDFSGVDPGPVLALTGTQEGLIVWKQDTITLVQGAVEENFSTEANRATISNTFGLIAPRSIVQLERDIYFLSPEGPKRIRGSYGAPEDLGRGRIAFSWSRFNRQAWDRVFGVYDPLMRHVLWFGPTTTSALDLWVGYSPFTDEVTNRPDMGFWIGEGFAPHGGAVVRDNLGQQRILLGLDAGVVYGYGSTGLYDDNGVGISRRVESRVHGRDIHGWKHADRLDAHFRGVTEITGAFTPIYDDEEGLTKQFMKGENTGGVWDEALWDVDVWDGSLLKVDYSRGLNGEFHGVRWRFQQDDPGETFALERVELLATVSDALPETVPA